MPPEPEKPIEELLEASAQSRRAAFGDDPKMPNPMRARLQDEVARTARERVPKLRAPWFLLRWPRLALGAAFASVLIATALTFWRAQQIPVTDTRLATGSSSAAPEMNRAESADRPAELTLQQAPADLEKSEGNAEAAAGAAEEKTLRWAKAAPASQPALENPRSSSSGAKFADSASVTQMRDAATANMKQQFSQAAANKLTGGAKAPRAPKILDNFQVEQNGSDLRIVEDDGSTYAGRIEPLAANDIRNLLKDKKAAPAAAATRRTDARTTEPDNQFYFRASGYNARLQKSLVFEGNYIVATSMPNPEVAARKSTGQATARIVGTAKVPGEPPVQIDAVAVPPQ